jgi:hypothetical protein
MTTAFDAKSNLVASLTTLLRQTWPEVEIGYGREAKTPQPRYYVWVGEWNYLDTEPVTIGAGKLQETYDMVVTIEVHNPGDTQEDANATAKAMYTQIQELLRVDRTQPNPLNIANPVSVVLRPSRFMEGINDDGSSRGAIFISLIRVTARL